MLPPPDLPAPLPGRYDLPRPPPSGIFDEAVFAYEPAARVWFEWNARRPLTVAARLQRKSTGESIDPAVLDRVWQGIQQVRPAGVRAVLAVEEEIVRGGNEMGELVDSLGNKAAGQLIKSEDWNALVAAVESLSESGGRSFRAR